MPNNFKGGVVTHEVSFVGGEAVCKLFGVQKVLFFGGGGVIFHTMQNCMV